MNWSMSPYAPLKGALSYIKVTVGMAAVGGLIVGRLYRETGEGLPDPVMEVPNGGTGSFGEFVTPIIDEMLQGFALFGYEALFWMPMQIFATLLLAGIAYFGIYRVGGKGWSP